MSILFSGDFNHNKHGELSSITRRELILKHGEARFNDIKYHIILGDAGFGWSGNQGSDIFIYKSLSRRPFPILCMIGNHEPILEMKNLHEADIGIGETVYQINENPLVAYLKPGKAYSIDGINFLVLGGALSHDKNSQIPDKTRWNRGYWSRDERQKVSNLLETSNAFDLVISNTGPHHINKLLFKEKERNFPEQFNDEAAFLNEEIHKKVQFREWWCAYWHEDCYLLDEETGFGYQYLYDKTRIIERIDDDIYLYTEYGINARGNLELLELNEEPTELSS